MIAAAKSGALPEYVSDAFPGSENNWEDLVTGATAAHRGGAIDLIAAFAHATEERLSYGCQQFLEEVLPRLKLDQPQVLELVIGLSERSRGQGLPSTSSIRFCPKP